MKLTRFLPCLLSLLVVPVAHATISFEIDADLLSNSSNVGIPDGSAIFLIVDKNNTGFVLPTAGALSVGSAWGGSSDNFVAETYSANGVAQNGAGSAGSVILTSNGYSYSTVSGMGPNQHLGLFWFPADSYNASSITLSGGDTFGYFDFNSVGTGTGSAPTLGASTWITPADTSFGVFFTINTPNAINEEPGNDVVTYGTIAVPEPSTFGLLGGVSALGLAFYRRRLAV
jgi:hypothetical protein